MKAFIYLFFWLLNFGLGLGWAFYAEDRTMVEDVVGAYELRSLKKLILNVSNTLGNQIQDVADNSAKVSSIKNLRSQLLERDFKFQVSADNLRKNVEDSKSLLSSVSTLLSTISMKINATISSGLATIGSFLEDTLKAVTQRSDDAFRVILASDCFDLFQLGFNASGSYWLQKFGIRVLCDMETDGGGWQVIQRRAKVDKQVNFDQNWFAYKMGFGDIDTEFWIGNDILHILTNQKIYELLIEMEDYEKGPFYARYSSFRVKSEESLYGLDVGNYTGNASDAFMYHHGQPFTTNDMDRDSSDTINCAQYFSGGWWYNKCYDAHLNGVFPDPPDRSNASFITWWLKEENATKVPLVLNKVIVKIRPRIL